MRRVDGQLSIRVRNGLVVSLRDSVDSNAVGIRYLYSQRIPRLSAHLVRYHFLEGGGFLLVSEATGRREPLDAPPTLAPSGPWFLTASADPDAGYDPNRIRVLRAAGDSVIVEWELEPTAFGPEQARWIDDSTVTFVLHPGAAADSAARESRVTVRRRGGVWSADSALRR